MLKSLAIRGPIHKSGIGVRILADALMINFALALALLVRFVFLVEFQAAAVRGRGSELFSNYVDGYLSASWLLTLVSLTVFYLSGFYTYGRVYRSRYKILLVAQAVTLAYLVTGFLEFFIRGSLSVPRAALILAWLFTAALLMTARVWSVLYRRVVISETDNVPQASAPIRRVLVIGGGGYIGSALLPKLLKDGYQVRLLDMLLYGNEPISNVLKHPNLEVIQDDFRQVDRLVQAMRGVDAVVHLGALVGDPACSVDEELTIEINLMATRMIAEVAKGWGVRRFVFASTCSVYGAGDNMLTEQSQLNPLSLYAKSKIASERVLLSMGTRAFAPTILRFGTIYGISGRVRFDLVVNLLTAKAIKEGKITVFGGDQWRPFVHVQDAAEAVARAIRAPHEVVADQIFNVGSDEQNCRIQEVAERIQAIVPSAELVSIDNDADKRDYRVSFAKIRKELRFEPSWELDAGIKQVIHAVQTGEVVDYMDARYSNVKFLREAGGTQKLPKQSGWERRLLDQPEDRPQAAARA